MTSIGHDRADEHASRRGRLRAGDEDRTQAASLLAEHYAHGRLDLAEFDERSSRALGAVHVDELQVLLEDLPGARVGRAPAVAPARRQAGRRPPSRAWLALVLVLAVGLVVVTRGAALWLLPMMWWFTRPARSRRPPGHWAGPPSLAAPSAWKAGPACHRWSPSSG